MGDVHTPNNSHMKPKWDALGKIDVMKTYFNKTIPQRKCAYMFLMMSVGW